MNGWQLRVEDARRAPWGVAVTDVDFRLLGSMQLRVGGVPATLPGAAERGLLALLLLSAGRTVAATSLIDRLWSESALPADPLNALQLRVSKLRRALATHGLDLISRDASGYRADIDPDLVDVHRFGAHVQARALPHERATAARLSARTSRPWCCGAATRSPTAPAKAGPRWRPPGLSSCIRPRSPGARSRRCSPPRRGRR